VNLVGLDTGRNQLLAIGCLQIDTRVTVARGREQLLGLRKSIRELLDDFRTDFVTAQIRRRTNRGAKVSELSAVLRLHLFDCAPDN
jgi:hypothetical protein